MHDDRITIRINFWINQWEVILKSRSCKVIEVLEVIACKYTCILCLSLATAEHRIAKGRGPTGTAVPRHRSSQLTAVYYLGLLLFTTHCFGCSRQLPNIVTKNRYSFCDLGRDGRPMWEIREITRARLQWKLHHFVIWAVSELCEAERMIFFLKLIDACLATLDRARSVRWMLLLLRINAL